jgi:hypothetical protein
MNIPGIRIGFNKSLRFKRLFLSLLVLHVGSSSLVARCEDCNLEYTRLSFELFLMEDQIPFLQQALAATNAAIQNAAATYNQLTQQIQAAESDEERQQLQDQRIDLTAQIAQLMSIRDGYDETLSNIGLAIAAMIALLNAMPDPCGHEEQSPSLCATCGNNLGQCNCGVCNQCGNPSHGCTCHVMLCPFCNFDSNYCGCYTGGGSEPPPDQPPPDQPPPDQPPPDQPPPDQPPPDEPPC